MTGAELTAAARDLMARRPAPHGLPPRVEDRVVLAQVASLLGPAALVAQAS